MMPYAPQTNYTAIMRPITQMEADRLTAAFNNLRRASVAVGVTSMVFALLTYVVGDIVWTIFALVFGLVAIGISIQVAQYRRRGTVALKNGVVTEITGFPVSSLFAGRMPGWAIGPIVVADPRQMIFQQGRLTTVACIPDLSLVLSVNGTLLTSTPQMKGPKHIEPTQAYPQAQAFPQMQGFPQR